MSLSKSRITRVKLLDGKTIHYPSDMELKQIWNDVECITYEELMTKEDWEKRFVIIRTEESEKPYWECHCGEMHPADYICTVLVSGK